MKIYVAAASPSNTRQYKKLLELWTISSKKHQICNTPEEADFIIITDIAGPGWFKDLRNHAAIKKPSQCFAVSDADYPMPLLHGVYTSHSKKLKFSSRFRTGAYNLFPEKSKNLIVQQSATNAYLEPKNFLYSFIGQDSSSVRLILFKMLSKKKDVLIVNSTEKFNAYHLKGENPKREQRSYVKTIIESKFALCPKGTSGASMRLFEVMQLGVAPIIISDEWILPKGPLWQEFAIVIKEKNIHQIDSILRDCENEYAIMGKKAQLAYKSFFADNVYFDYLINQLIDIKKNQKIPEKFFWNCRNFIVKFWMFQRRLGLPCLGRY
ncbi:MAG: exostosin family protein [Chthoniobacterales bacterium]